MDSGNERGNGMSSDGNSRRRARHSLLGRLLSNRPPDHLEEQDRLLRTCPECAESVYVLADRCRHCGTELSAPSQVG